MHVQVFHEDLMANSINDSNHKRDGFASGLHDFFFSCFVSDWLPSVLIILDTDRLHNAHSHKKPVFDLKNVGQKAAEAFQVSQYQICHTSHQI